MDVEEAKAVLSGQLKVTRGNLALRGLTSPEKRLVYSRAGNRAHATLMELHLSEYRELYNEYLVEEADRIREAHRALNGSET